MTSKEKYEKLINFFKSPDMAYYGITHSHHIYPKSIWPRLSDAKDNIVELPPVLHWYAHVLLNEAFDEIGKSEYHLKLTNVPDSIAQFINSKLKPSKQIDFSRTDELRERLDAMLDSEYGLYERYLAARDLFVDELYDSSVVCVLTRCKDKFSVIVKPALEIGGITEFSRVISANEIKTYAENLKTNPTQYTRVEYKELSDIGLTNIANIREFIDEWNSIYTKYGNFYQYHIRSKFDDISLPERMPKLFDII